MDSKPLSLATASILGQPPRVFRQGYFEGIEVEKWLGAQEQD